MPERYRKGTRNSYVMQLETVQMAAAAKKIIGCSSKTSKTALLRAELGAYPLKLIVT